jgi:hypothetical protein
MTDEHAHLDEALDKVIAAARAHLTAVKAADGRVDDDGVWKAYVELNNASFAYDDALLDAYGEVTPWDVDAIDPDLADEKIGAMADLAAATDPHTHIVSVRQRRDYRVPSVSALIKAAQAARHDAMHGEDGADDPVESVGEAVLELLQSGDGSLAALDLPELEPLDGLVAVVEADKPLDLSSFDEVDGSGPFTLAPAERLVGRLDEQPYADLEEDDDDLEDLDVEDDDRR